MSPKHRGLAIISAALLCVTGTACAQSDLATLDQKDEKKPAAPTAEIECWVIRATTKNSTIDPELKPLAKALQNQFKFTGFKREKKLTSTTKFGETFKADLLEEYRIEITPLERKPEPKKEDPKKESPKKDEEKRGQPERSAPLQFQVVIRKGNEKDPVVTVPCTVKPGEFQPVGGPKLAGGDTLIVAISGK